MQACLTLAIGLDECKIVTVCQGRPGLLVGKYKMAKTYDVLVQGGLVVAGCGIRKADVGIKGEQIAAIESKIPPAEAKQVIDASGKYVLPGAIDVHVHPVYEDDLGGSSLTAAHGGTTTVLHFAYARPGMKLIDTIKKFQEEGLRKSYLDFGVHGTLFDASSRLPRSQKRLSWESHPSRCS